MFILKIDWGLLWERPFRPEVWGTVSDWMMVAVTTATAVFLVKTFREQQKITRIEEFRHAESIKPSFDITYTRRNEVIRNEILRAEFTFCVTVNDHATKNLNITARKPFEPSGIPIKMIKSEILYPGSKEWAITGPIAASTYSKKDNDEKFSFWLYVKLSFEDTSGTRYSQDFQINDSNHGSNEIVAGPIIRVDPLFPRYKS